MSLTPVDEAQPLVKIMEPKIRFSVDNGPKLPEEGDQTYPLRKMFNDLEYKSIDNMHKFAREGDSDKLSRLINHNKLKAKKYVNTLDNEKMAPLHYAARYNHLECVKVLVNLAEANVNVTNEEKVTPIHFAARYRRKSNKTGDPEIQSQNKWKDLVEIMHKTKSESTVKRLLEEEQKPTLNNSVILYLVSEGGQPNAQDMYGCTPLHYAAMRGNEVAASQLLMLEEVNTEVEDNESMTPLHLACAHNHDKIAEMLLDRKANLFNCEESGLIPFHIVCTEGCLRLANILVEMAEESNTLAKMLNSVDHELNTPLHYAVENGHVEIVRLCLDKGANPNSINHVGETPLHMASHCGSVELVQMITAAGARLDVVDNSDQTPMHEAARKNHVPVIEYLIKQGADTESRDVDSYTPFLMASSYGHSNTVQLFLTMNCDIFATDKENKTALYLAVENNYPEVVKTLLQDETNRELLNVPDLNSNYPLHIACKNGRAEVVEILLDCNADDDVKNEEEQTPMHLAAKYGRTQIIKILHARSGESLIADEDEDSNTPLHLAAYSGFAKTVQILLDMGADINARNCNKWSPLDCAAAKGNFKVAQVLLQNDSPVDPMDKSKITPLYLACKNGHEKLVKLLLKNKANIGQRISSEDDDAGCNALDAAIDNGHRECALAILERNDWEVAMRNQTGPVPGKIDTPMRKLIRKMPDVAEIVFNKCCISNNKHMDSKDFAVTYNFEFLEDTYASWGLNENSVAYEKAENNENKETDSDSTTRVLGQCNIYDENDRLLPTARVYTSNTKRLQKNHPLMIMVISEREDLLDHPLVTNLLNIKWNNFGQIVYYLNLSIYLMFLVSLLSYMLVVEPPYQYYLKHTDIGNNFSSTCLGVQAVLPNEKLRDSANIFKFFVIVLSAFGIFKEIIQMFIKKKHYFGIENFMEWTLYILAFISVLDTSWCQKEIGIRESWQWQTGTTASLIGITNLVLFIRKVPFFGIFVVMFTDVMWTFLKFLPLFLLFIFAFAFAFHLLLSNHVAFFTLLNSMVRTMVMTIGEFDFDDVFNAQYGSEVSADQKISYDGVTYTVFVVFVIVMSIITMNLLVGLAVDDIKAVQEKATLKRLAMQVTLALDVEGLAPEILRRRYVFRKVTVYPNRFSRLFEKIFSLGHDVKSYMPLTNESMNEVERIEAQQKTANEQIANVKQKIKSLQDQNESIVSMLTDIMKHMKINIEEDDFEDEVDI